MSFCMYPYMYPYMYSYMNSYMLLSCIRQSRLDKLVDIALT
jgi:hypothetical protein